MTAAADAAGLDLSRLLRPGDHIVWGNACGEPTVLVEALIAQATGIGELHAFAVSSFSGLLDPTAAERLRISSIGAIGTLRGLAAAHRLQIVPCNGSQIGSLIEQGVIGCDVVLVQVSPPDGQGNHSFGLSCDFMPAAVARARVVIAEVNERVPFTCGDAVLPAARIDHALRVARNPVEVPPARIGAIEQAIAANAAAYVGDGAILQIGIGAVPDSMLRLLKDRRDLGIHSGMIGDGLVDLVECGAVTNATKAVDTGISVVTNLLGSRRLYDFAHRNRQLAVRSVACLYDPAVLCRLRGLVTINSAMEVDLSGQVNAEQSGGQYIGAVGGQADFVRLGGRLAGGRSIIALPATARDGGLSRITARLTGPVTTARSDVDVIVTEFGAAELKGQTLAERARRLVAIAHPDFRAELDRAAHAIGQRGY